MRWRATVGVPVLAAAWVWIVGSIQAAGPTAWASPVAIAMSDDPGVHLVPLKGAVTAPGPGGGYDASGRVFHLRASSGIIRVRIDLTGRRVPDRLVLIVAPWTSRLEGLTLVTPDKHEHSLIERDWAGVTLAAGSVTIALREPALAVLASGSVLQLIDVYR